MSVREKRQVLKSLVTPGSSKFCALKNANHQLLYIVLLLNADDYGLLPGSSSLPDEDTNPATEVLRLCINLGYNLESTGVGLAALERVGLIKIHRETKPIIIQITGFESTQDGLYPSSRSSKLVLLLPSTSEKSGPQSVSKYSLSSTNQDNTADGGLFNQCRKLYRQSGRKAMPGLGNRAATWTGLVKANGEKKIMTAFCLWLDNLSKYPEEPYSPLGNFLHCVDDWLTAADIELTVAADKQADEAKVATMTASVAVAEAADDARLQSRVLKAQENSKQNAAIVDALKGGF